jgi:D-alanyl-D-alanine dipeptidase
MIVNLLVHNLSFADEAPRHWSVPQIDKIVSENVLYLPIADSKVKSITLDEIDEEVVDLLKINNARIRPLSVIDPQYKNTYEGFSKVRLGVYEKLVKMLELLPKNIGIAYFEGFRPLWKQKEYFDNKFKEILVEVKDKELAYQETTKHVSPFIDNIPTHGTGAAIDITLFETKDEEDVLIDMGMFDTIYGHNPAQETFSENTTQQQRKNRLMLLNAAARSGLVNYGFEWWHYSYGDKAWAYVKKQKAIYGLAGDKNDPILSLDKKTYLQSVE